MADNEINQRYSNPIFVSQTENPETAIINGTPIPGYEYEYCDDSDGITHAKITISTETCEYSQYQLLSYSSGGTC